MDDENPNSKYAVLVIALLIVMTATDRAVGTDSGVKSLMVTPVEAAVQGPGVDYKEEELQTAQTFETVQGTLLEVCEARGYGEDCARTLLGMLWKESLNDAQAIGDGGQARGYFQIWYRLHHISIDCAENLTCSANWTIDYLESNGYPRHKTYAVQCHNGCNIANGYWQSALRWGDRKWNTPMFLSEVEHNIALK
ncbi:MAG: hypothetical protein V1738_03580 [Patescibacteria group bacterium]